MSKRSPSKCCKLPVSAGTVFLWEKLAERAVTSGWRALTDVPTSLVIQLREIFKDKRLQNEKTPWNRAFAAVKRLVRNGVKLVVKTSGHFRASFVEEQGAAKFHQKFHGIFHGNFHAPFQEKISRQHLWTPCRDENLIFPVWDCKAASVKPQPPFWEKSYPELTVMN